MPKIKKIIKFERVKRSALIHPYKNNYFCVLILQNNSYIKPYFSAWSIFAIEIICQKWGSPGCWSITITHAYLFRPKSVWWKEGDHLAFRVVLKLGSYSTWYASLNKACPNFQHGISKKNSGVLVTIVLRDKWI